MIYRQLKGEELQGLGMEELIKLEKMIEAGLNRVTKSKVLQLFFPFHFSLLLCMVFLPSRNV